jgi:hypothetical protein
MISRNGKPEVILNKKPVIMKRIDIQTRLALSNFVSNKDLISIAKQHKISKSKIENIFYGQTYVSHKNKDVFNSIIQKAKQNKISFCNQLESIKEL